jgi:phosphoribosyl 1,2-cyclic phosphodiesterase
MRLTFVGTGVSCGIPVIGHLMTNCACRDAIRNPNGPNHRNNVSLMISLPFPTTNTTATAGSHVQSAIEGADAADDVEWHHILIDCGKTFRNAYLRVLAPMRVRYVDALLLTHGHADAMHCVEELCGMQAEAARDFNGAAAAAATAFVSSSTQATDVPVAGEERGNEIPRTLRRIPTYLTFPTLEQIEMVSRDLARSSFHVGMAPTSLATYAQAMRDTEEAVSSYAVETSVFNAPSTVMDLFFLNESGPQRIYVPIGPLSSHLPPATTTTASTSQPAKGTAELPFYSFPVEHGPTYISMCFVFGRGVAFKNHSRGESSSSSPPLSQGSCVVYISDVSAIPANSMSFLLDLVKIDVLILDLLAEHGAPSASHYCADEAIPMVVQLAPRKVYFVGMFCSLEHHATNKQLAQELADMKAQVQKELDGAVAHEAGTPEQSAAYALKRRFLEETVSMELAYDGQQLDIDT